MNKDLIEEYFEISTRFQKAWKNYMYTVLGDEEISVAQIGVLFILRENKTSISSEIAAKLHVSRSAVTQLIDGLFERGYIMRYEDSKDRRITHISLSRSGLLKLKTLDKRRREIFNALVSELNDQQIRSAIEINTLMLRQLEK